MPARQRLESSRTGVAVTRRRSIPVLAAVVNRRMPAGRRRTGWPNPAEEAAIRPDPGPTPCAHANSRMRPPLLAVHVRELRRRIVLSGAAIAGRARRLVADLPRPVPLLPGAAAAAAEPDRVRRYPERVAQATCPVQDALGLTAARSAHRF